MSRPVGRCALALALTLLAAGCRPRAAEAPAPGYEGGPVWLEQGWTQADQALWSAQSQGSLLVPLDWFLHLERPQDQVLFRSAENLQPYGALVDPPSSWNPHGLPVGLAANTDFETGEEHVGFACAFCHTGELHHDGHRIRLSGGAPAQLDIAGLVAGLLDSVRATRDDSARLERLAAAVGRPVAELGPELDAWLARFGPRFAANTPDTPYGPGRLDAMATMLNNVSHDLGLVENVATPTGMVSSPPVWNSHRVVRSLWTGSVMNRGPAALAANVAQIVSLFPRVDVRPERSNPGGYASSIDVASLGAVQAAVKRLDSPRWPEELLGALDTQRAERGRALYEAHCLSCHAIADESDSALDFSLVSIAEVGTDPEAAETVLRTLQTGPLEGRRAEFIRGARLGPEAQGLSVMGNVVVGVMMGRSGALMGAIQQANTPGLPPVSDHPFVPRAYKAQHLSGVWSSAPYLHNGSVASLYQLLLPASQRLAQFPLGQRLFDPVEVGWSREVEGGFAFDTTLQGNSNAGHEYGTALAESERWDLIEYLKTL